MATFDLDAGITFGREGNAPHFVTGGWGSMDDNPTVAWTAGPVAELTFTMPAPRKRLALEIKAYPYLVDGRVSFQDLFVYLNGLFCGFHRYSDGGLSVHSVPRDRFSPRDNVLSLVLPCAVSPSDLGVSQDTRRLGLAVETIRLVEAA